MGAAAMLRDSPGTPLLLQACKASMGHTEPAAGAVGMLHALDAIRTHAAAGILHMRTVNPHVQPTSMARMAAPRQPAPFVQASNGGVVGISAFAFQGTNAHALLCAPTQARHHQVQQELRWNHQDVNVAPPRHPLVSGTFMSASTATFACALEHPCNAFLWQHVVGGRALLPATAYLEMLHAALTMLGSKGVLQDVAFKRPYLLDDARKGLHVRVQVDSGEMEVVCGSAVHATARVAPVGAVGGPQHTRALLAMEEHFNTHASGVADVTWQLEARAYAVHPAALDSVLQLAAACQQPGQLSSVPSVPSLLAACAFSHTAAHNTLHAATHTRPAARGGATSSYRVPGVCWLADLTSRPLAPAKEAAVAPQTGMYALTWLAEQQETQPLPASQLELQPSSISAALAAVQCAAAKHIVGVSLSTAMAGVMRSAASELGQCSVQSVGGSPVRLMLGEGTALQTDGYGARAGTPATRVALLRRAAHPQPLRYQLQARPRGALQNLVAGPVEAVQRTLPMLHVQATGINFRDVLNVLVRLGCYGHNHTTPPSPLRACILVIQVPPAATAPAWLQAAHPLARACLGLQRAAWAPPRPLRR